ncbi:MAG TPA: type I polyketide synthase [Pyrinomonadaceae bacterium]
MSNTTSDRVSQLSPIKRALLAVEQMQSKLDAIESAKTEPIAIVGMGCRFPGGANSPEAFWHLLRDGVNAVTEVPADRWDIEAYFDPNPEAPGKMYTRWGAFIDKVDEFDPGFFGIAPREALSMDPQQRLLLEVTWEALENAGQNSEKLAGSKTGVFVGMMNNEYFQHIKQQGPGAIDAYYGTGNVTSSAAGRLSYALGFNGPSMTIDTACSASLVATHLACQSLRNGECDMALASGVNLILLPDVTLYMCRAKTMAADGRCKTFDAAADGYVRGEGCGVVVLKRLSDALADGDNILAVVRGSAVKHDGRSGGFTVPSGSAQQEVIREALANAGVAPSEVGYVEAHGTGTPLGDPIEMRALGSVMNGERRNPLMVGSVKTNIGHLESAAGIAGLIKTVLALQHGEIPPHLHLREVNPQISLAEVGATIPTAPTTFAVEDEQRRLAGVSSFGLTGTIAHAVLEEAPRPVALPERRPEAEADGEAQAHLLALSARDVNALQSLATTYSDFLSREDLTAPLADVSYTAGARRTHHEHRLAIVGRSRTELAEGLKAFQDGQQFPAVSAGRKLPGHTPKVVFVFPGQGSQWVGMGRRLLREEAVFRALIERCDELMRSHADWSLLDEINADEMRSRLDEIDVAQPVIFAIQVSLAALWRSWGIEPDAVVGQSMGEIAAAHVAGALSLEDAVQIICRRSQLLKRMSGLGSMAAVELSLEQAQAALLGYEGRLSVAVSNSHVSTVIAGETEALEEILKKLQQQGVFCRQVKVNIASHSPQMEPLRDDLLRALEGVRAQTPALPIYSTVTGEFSRDERFDAAYWWRNLREPVLFSAAVGRLLEGEFQTFLEVSPHPILLSAIQQEMYHCEREGVVLPSLRRGEDERTVLLSSLGSLYASGHAINWGSLFQDGGRCIQLPNYPWQRSRFWVEHDASATTDGWASRRAQGRQSTHPLLGSHIAPAHPSLGHLWEFKLEARLLPFLNDHRVQGSMVLPATAYVEMALSGAAQAFDAQTCRLAALEFHKALFVPEDGVRLVQMSFSSGAEGGTLFHVYSRADKPETTDNWTLHATGQLQLAPAEHAVSQAAHPSLEAVRKRCPEEVSSEEFYSLLSAAGNSYGPGFRAVENLWRGEGEAVARLLTPQILAAETGRYSFHPALLDSCLQLLGATLSAHDEASLRGAYVPTGIDEVRVHGDLPPQLWSHARLRRDEKFDGNSLKGDILLFDEDGNVVLEFVGVRVQSLESSPGQFDERKIGELFYELRWEEQEARTPERAETCQETHAQGADGWLIFADGQGVGASLAALLDERGGKAVLVSPGEQFERVGERSFRLNPARVEDVRQLFEAVSASIDFDCRGIVHLWNLDNAPLEESTSASLRELPLKSCFSVVTLAQTLAEVEWRVQPRMWLVSEGAQPVRDEPRIAVTQAPLWGLGRTLAQELPGFFGGLIDLEAGAPPEQSAQLLSSEIVAPTGEQQIAFRQDHRFVARLVRRRTEQRAGQTLRLRADGTYLITGGLGALGLTVARWMVEQGARRLVLMGRTMLPPRSAWKQLASEGTAASQIQAIRELEALGASVHLAAVDAADESQVRAFLDTFEQEGWPSIRGVVHAAGVLHDSTLLQLDADSFNQTWLPKVAGSWLLHSLLSQESLDFLILFSSAASLLGSPGQANYAAANSFLDALAQQRRAQGLHALSINWGAWAEVGLAASAERGGRLAQRGFQSIAPREGLEALAQLVRQDTAQAGVIPVDWSLVREFNPEIAALPLFSQVAFVEDETAEQITRANVKSSLTRELLLASELPERERLLDDYLRELLARVLRIAQTAIDPLKPINTMGLDSLMAIEFKNALETNLGILLPMVSIMQGPSISQLVRQVLDLLAEQASLNSTTSDFDVTPDSESDAFSAEVVGLSQEEAEQLLAGLDELSSEQVSQLLANMLTEAQDR